MATDDVFVYGVADGGGDAPPGTTLQSANANLKLCEVNKRIDA